MKTVFAKTLLSCTLLILFACAVAYVHAQQAVIDSILQEAPPTGDPFGQEGGNSGAVLALLKWYNFAMIFVAYFVTYVSSRIPYLRDIPNLAWRAVVVTGLVGLIFWRLGADGLGVAVAFLTVVNPYDAVLKPALGATPTTGSHAPPREPEGEA